MFTFQAFSFFSFCENQNLIAVHNLTIHNNPEASMLNIAVLKELTFSWNKNKSWNYYYSYNYIVIKNGILYYVRDLNLYIK